MEKIECHTVGDLSNAIEGVDPEQMLTCQVVDKVGNAWNMEVTFTPKLPKSNQSVLTVSHPQLQRLPMAGDGDYWYANNGKTNKITPFQDFNINRMEYLLNYMKGKITFIEYIRDTVESLKGDAEWLNANQPTANGYQYAIMSDNYTSDNDIELVTHLLHVVHHLRVKITRQETLTNGIAFFTVSF